MKKIWSVLLSVLLGAIVVGIGTGYFLFLANKDRQILAAEANTAKLQAKQALQESQKAIEEANTKLQEANVQVINAEKALEALRNEHALLEYAEPLLKPTGNSQEGWLSAISTAQGVSMMFPPGSIIKHNNENLLAIGSETTSSSTWLQVIPCSEIVFNDMLAEIASSTPIAYFIDGKLVAGRKGLEKNTDSETGLLKIFAKGLCTQIVRIQNPPPFKIKSWQKEQKISFTEILKTFEFQK